jgi:hypothetical protein
VSAPVLQLRVPETTLARLDDARGEETRSAWVLRLIDRELSGQTGTPPRAAAPSLAALPDGGPSPGVLCMGPGCWERSTSKYGLRQLPLCPACRAALEGRPYQREIPPSAARLMRRGAPDRPRSSRPGSATAAMTASLYRNYETYRSDLSRAASSTLA